MFLKKTRIILCSKMGENFDLKIKCILCGSQICGVKEPFRYKTSEEIDLWNKESVNSLWELLFKSGNTETEENTDKDDLSSSSKTLETSNCSKQSKYLLNNANYCSKCRQRVWNLDFQFKMLRRLRKQITSVCRVILKDIKVNYNQHVTFRQTDPATDDSAIINSTAQEAESTLSNSFSYQDALNIIFKDLEVQGRFSEFTTDNSNNFNITVKVDPDDVLAAEETADIERKPNGRKCRRSHRRKPDTLKNEAVDNLESVLNIKEEPLFEYEDERSDSERDLDFLPPNDPDEDGLSSDEDNFDPGLEELDDDGQDEEFILLKPNKSKTDYKVLGKSKLEIKSGPKSPRKRRTKKTDQEISEKADKIRKKNVPCSEPNCSRLFKDQLFMNAHVRRVHLDLPNPYHCAPCNKDFRDASNLRSHIHGQHEGTFRFSCPTCNKGFNYKMNLKGHIDKAHNSKLQLPQFDHSCTICTKGFKTLEDLQLHIKRHHEGPTPFSCEDCSESFENSADLINHVKKVHQNLKTQRFLCSACGKSFCSRWYLRTHERLIHTTNGTDGLGLKCKDCGKTFVNLGMMKKHEQKEHPPEGQEATKGLQCEICGKKFKEPNGLKYHLMTHSGEKPIKCKICGKGFYQTAHCKKHEQTHSGVRKSICGICGKACTNKDNLKLHMKVHDKEGSIGASRKVKTKRSEIKEDMASNILNRGSRPRVTYDNIVYAQPPRFQASQSQSGSSSIAQVGFGSCNPAMLEFSHLDPTAAPSAMYRSNQNQAYHSTGYHM